MSSHSLDRAIARVRTVFAGMTSPTETGCGRCHLPSETELLRTPDVPVPPDVLAMFGREVADHFDDRDASIRRLLPDLVVLIASGEIDSDYGGLNSMGGIRWSEWPVEQREAVFGFFEAWFTQALRTPPEASAAGVSVAGPAFDQVLQTCVSALSTATPFLALWAAEPLGSVADAHLESWVELNTYDIINDEWPFGWWCDYSRDKPVAEVQAWLREHASTRLRAQGADPGLLFPIDLLDLPYDDRRPALEARDEALASEAG
ncbi:hypothetical protein ACFT7S_09630 [Streptomyces sp. NPDC057136]|uniref:hypothetical protein n=1 Tax=Streptomyces sp. NPDC057136 TaxID=3346029 RepID=UPI00363419ED